MTKAVSMFSLLCFPVAGLLIASPIYWYLPENITKWKNDSIAKHELAIKKTAILNEGELDKTTITARAMIAKEAAKQKQAVPNRSLRLVGYSYEKGVPPKTIGTKGYLRTDRIQVYDNTGTCFGEVYGRKFKFIDDFPKICDNPPEQTTGEQNKITNISN